MKILFSLLTAFLIQNSYAQTTTLKQGDLGLSGIPGTLISVEGKIAKIKVTMTGCMDRLGGYFSKYEVVDGIDTLYFSAINIFNVASTYSRCSKMPSKVISIDLPQEGDVRLVNFDYSGVTSK